MDLITLGIAGTTILYIVYSYLKGDLNPYKDEEKENPELYREKYIDKETGEDLSKRSPYREYKRNQNKNKNKDEDKDEK